MTWQPFTEATPAMQERIEVGIKRDDEPYIFRSPFVWHPGGYCFSEEKDQDGESLVVIRPPFITHWRSYQERN